MELLLGAIVVLVSQGFKWLTAKIGFNLGKALTIVSVFAFSLIGVVIYISMQDGNVIDWTDWKTLGMVWGFAELWYTVLIKRLPFLRVSKK